MSKIHLLLQGKGGVGKSFVAALLAQYKIDKGHKPLCIDTDPVNATLFGYKGLGVKRLQIMEAEEINPRSFDTLIEMIAPVTDDVIIDNGASSFVPLSHFLISNQVPALLTEMGHELVVHTLVTGGQALLDTWALRFGSPIMSFVFGWRVHVLKDWYSTVPMVFSIFIAVHFAASAPVRFPRFAMNSAAPLSVGDLKLSCT